MLDGRLAWPLRLAAVALAAAGCLPSISSLDQKPLTETFAVSDYFVPSGYMGDGEFFGDLVGGTNQGCKPRAGLARGNCYSFTYWPNNLGVDPWAGVFWVFPSNSWGSTSGHAIDMSKFKQISFWAAVDGPAPYTVSGNQVPFVGQAGNINPRGTYANADAGTLDYVDVIYTNYAWYVDDPAGVTTEIKQFHIPLTAAQKGANCIDPETAAMNNKAINCTGTTAEILAWSGYAPALRSSGPSPGRCTIRATYPKCSDNTDNCHAPIDSSKFVNPPPVHIYLDDIVWDTAAPPATRENS